MVTYEAGATLTDGTLVNLWVPSSLFIDPNSLLFMLIAVGVVAVGSWWSTAEERSEPPAHVNARPAVDEESSEVGQFAST